MLPSVAHAILGGMIQHPAISILIPTYNRVTFLPEALASVLAQQPVGRTDIEILIVDDGSTDDTIAYLQQLTDSRIRWVRQENAGTAAARNTALAMARGTYIACLDSDDRWDANFLAMLVPILEHDPDVGVVYARCRTMDVAGNPLSRLVGVPPLYSDDMLASLLYGDHLCAIGAITRRDLLQQVGGWEQTLINTEDWDLWLKLAPLTRFHFVDHVLASIRSHSGRATGHASPRARRVIADRMRVLSRAYARQGLTARAQAIRPIAYRNLYTDLMIRNWEAFGWHEGFRYAMHAMLVAPNRHQAFSRLLVHLLNRRLLSQTHWGVWLADWVARRRRRR
jgi:glycosyltransferase involved in cell wall biosynthesis